MAKEISTGWVRPRGRVLVTHVPSSRDFNGDGHPDLAVTDLQGEGSLSVLSGNSDGTFQPPVKVFANADPFFVTAADLNGDGKLDLVVVNLAEVNSVLSILLGNGDGTFAKPKDIFNAANDAYWIAVADFNGDGIPDLALANRNSSNVTILLGTGGGNSGTPPEHLGPPGGQGNGAFTPPKLIEMNDPFAVAACDFNGDHAADLSRRPGPNVMTVLLGNGSGFQAAPSTAIGQLPLSIATGDSMPTESWISR